MDFDVSGGKTHKEQLVMEQRDIFGLFVRTFESVTYTKMLLTAGSVNLGGMGVISTLGQGGGSMCHCNKKKMGGL
jgi:hypothetical protein